MTSLPSTEELTAYGARTLRTIAVAIDFSRPSDHALDLAIVFAQRFGSCLQLVHVLSGNVPSQDTNTGAPADISLRLNQFVQHCHGRGVSAAAHVMPESSDVYRSILDTAQKHKAGLIVLGTHGRSGLRRAVLGSVAERVIRHADVPVLAIAKRKHPY